MKRTARLGPGKKSQDRGSTFGKPRQAMKRRGRKRVSGFGRLVDGPCVYSHLPGQCWGEHTGHHVVKQQAIKARFPHGALLEDGQPPRPAPRIVIPAEGVKHLALEVLLKDRRILRRVCAGHHPHAEPEAGHVTRDQVPESAEDFAAQYGLTWWLDRHYNQPKGDAA